MKKFAIITENDVSEWSGKTGVVYHFPKRYLKFLQPGTLVIYYKGVLKNKAFAKKRLTDKHHYFGIAEVGENYIDKASSKKDHFVFIENFKQFEEPILAKQDGNFLETIPENRKTNYWRDAVRQIDQITYDRIVNSVLNMSAPRLFLTDTNNDITVSLESGFEGGQTKRYVTLYERNKDLRVAALKIHGLSCHVCRFNFEENYGEFARGYIQVHHIIPISEGKSNEPVNPKTDLVTVCANCHAIIHRKRDTTKSIDEMKAMLKC